MSKSSFNNYKCIFKGKLYLSVLVSENSFVKGVDYWFDYGRSNIGKSLRF